MKTNKRQTLDYQAPTTEVVVLMSECVMNQGSVNLPGEEQYEEE